MSTKGTWPLGRSTIDPTIAATLGYPRVGAIHTDAANNGPTSSTAGVYAGGIYAKADNAGTPTAITYYLNIGTKRTQPFGTLTLAEYRALVAGDTLPVAAVAYSGTKSIGSLAPTNGSTAGNTGDLYYATTPDTVYACDNGSTDHWTNITAGLIAITTPQAGAPTDGTPGTGAGVYGYGSLMFFHDTGDTDAGADGWYMNKGTLAAPSWTAVLLPFD